MKAYEISKNIHTGCTSSMRSSEGTTNNGANILVIIPTSDSSYWLRNILKKFQTKQQMHLR